MENFNVKSYLMETHKKSIAKEIPELTAGFGWKAQEHRQTWIIFISTALSSINEIDKHMQRGR